jgi:hypothetical protein
MLPIDLWGFIVGYTCVYIIIKIMQHADVLSDGNVGAEDEHTA